MALGSTITFDLDQTYHGTGDYTAVYPASMSSEWVVAIDANGSGSNPSDPGINTADANPLIRPDSQIGFTTRHMLDRDKRHGTTLKIRLRYDGNATKKDQPPRVRVFGRSGTQQWEVLRTKGGAPWRAIEIDLVNDVANTVIGTGAYKWTTPDDLEDSFDCQGCDKILIGVEVALNHGTSGGDNAIAQLEAKII